MSDANLKKTKNSQINRALRLRSPMRCAVVDCLLSDYTTAEIAEELNLAKSTVEHYKVLIARYYGIPKYTPLTREVLLLHILKPFIACSIDVTLLR